MQAEHLAGTDDISTDFLVGTGPYKFKSYIPGSALEVERNNNYFKYDAWGNQLPYLDGVIYYMMASAIPLEDAYIAGLLDVYSLGQTIQNYTSVERIMNEEATPSNFPQVQGDYAYQAWFNQDFEPFKDVRVRQAFRLLLDPYQVNIAWTTHEKTANPGRWLFGTAWGLTKDEIAELAGWDQPWEDRVAQAKQLMADAGYASGFSFRCVYSATTPGMGMPPAMAVYDDLLDEINVEIIHEGVMAAEIYARYGQPDTWDMYAHIIYTLIADPDATSSYFMCGSPVNPWGFCDPEIDALWEAQSKELDSYKRWEIVQDIERLMIERVPSVPMAWTNGFQPMRTYVMNWRWCGGIYGPHIKMEDLWMKQ
jgi:peptide/nickel transport system substrate-binding protein